MLARKESAVTTTPLNETGLEQLRTKGWVRTRMFTPDDAAAMEDRVWRRLEKHGVDRDDPSTWSDHRPGGLSHSIRKTQLFQMGTVTDGFRAVCDQLLGAERWSMGKTRACCSTPSRRISRAGT